MKAARFTADEIERVAYLTTKGYLPVAVDVASRVFQVCYYDLGAKHVRNYQLSRVKFFEFIDDTFLIHGRTPFLNEKLEMRNAGAAHKKQKRRGV